MKSVGLVTVWALGMALTAVGCKSNDDSVDSGAGDGGDGSVDQAMDAPTDEPIDSSVGDYAPSPGSCGEYYNCVNDPSCRTSASCVAACGNKVSTEGKAKYDALLQCMRDHCCVAGGACGGTPTACDPVKKTSSACCDCTAKMRCGGSGGTPAAPRPPDPSVALCADKLGECFDLPIENIGCAGETCGSSSGP